eukprot:1022222-Pleurochrysis_carterae.AAC.2
MELPAVMGGFLNVTTLEGNEIMRRQIQEVLRKAGEEPSDRGTAEEREDMRGVEVNSVQQLYVSVRGTSAATNKFEFGYTTPSGEELKWGPTRFTLYSEYHKRTLKVKSNTARTYHTVRGALILNEQAKWCELCAQAHGKECEQLRAYRTEEARRTQDLMAKAKRGTAPTLAQQQAARPEYTLNVEKEKQMRNLETREGIVEETGGKAKMPNANEGSCDAGTGGSCDLGVRGAGEGSRGSMVTTPSETGRGSIADSLPGLQAASGELSLCAAQVQVFPLQSLVERDARRAQGLCIGGGEEGTHAGMAATGQGTRKRGGSRTQWSRGERAQRQRWQGWMVADSTRNERKVSKDGSGAKDESRDLMRLKQLRRDVENQAAAETSGTCVTLNGLRAPFDRNRAISCSICRAIHTRTSRTACMKTRDKQQRWE